MYTTYIAMYNTINKFHTFEPGDSLIFFNCLKTIFVSAPLGFVPMYIMVGKQLSVNHWTTMCFTYTNILTNSPMEVPYIIDSFKPSYYVHMCRVSRLPSIGVIRNHD